MAEKYESFDLSGTKIYVSEDHRFGTDAFLLADFADPAPHHKVCDLCTGCGIVPLIMCRNISKKPPKEIYGVEIMPEAVELFDKSVAENNLSDRIKPVLCDLKDPQGDGKSALLEKRLGRGTTFRCTGGGKTRDTVQYRRCYEDSLVAVEVRR